MKSIWTSTIVEYLFFRSYIYLTRLAHTFVLVGAVVPLTSLGVVDVGGTDVADRDVLANALANISQSELRESYAIRRGSAFVNEYARTDASGRRSDGGPEDPSHLLGAFPTLLPYGKGGIETNRRVKVSYAEHSKRDLQYWDKRFRKDHHYVFQLFGVLQKRQVCSSAGLQIKRKDFYKHEAMIRSLKPSDLLQAAGEESRRVPFSNEAVKNLRKHITSIRSKVMGTDESRVSIRSKIWSLIAQIGPPSLWITLNPSDTGDPIAQALTGADIDLDKFIDSLGPNATTRSNSIATDPYAAAKYFHFIIDTVLELLFGIKPCERGHIRRRPGIFGNMEAYIGTVEAQGRGTLHFHMIGWLKGAPTADRMKELLQEETFRAKLVRFIHSAIKSDIGGANAEQVRAMNREEAVSFSRPVDPRQGNYSVRSHEAEKRLARAVQVHRCTAEGCLKLVRGRLVCKRNAPFPLSENDWVDEDGRWGSTRKYGYVNAWCPPLLQTVRANQDIKLITNGGETKDIAWYISKYVAKNQGNSSNVSALLAQRIAFHGQQERYNADVTSRNKRLLQRCANTLSREQTFSAPEVMAYLMSFGDRKISHHFIPLYTNDIISALRKVYPSLRYKK
jgi:hypothetical protein